MSKIGKIPIEFPDGVTIKQDGYHFTVNGPKGDLSRTLNSEMIYEIDSKGITVKRPSDGKKHRSMHGLTRTLLSNMVIGVSNGYSRNLEIQGVGFKAEMKGKNLLLTIGYSHPIFFMPPAEIEILTQTPTQISISGIDKELVGQVAAKIRSFRKPEPYKGKGIRYQGEVVRRKAGKSGKV